MDATLHTIIATGLMFASFHAGKYFGKNGGYHNIIETLLHCFRADSLEITEDADFFVTVDGETRKVN